MTQPYPYTQQHFGSSHGSQRAIPLPPEMELRVRRPGSGATVDARRVSDRLTLGRAAASDLIVDDPFVNLIHARIVTGVGGGWELRCVGGARLTLPDGDVVDRLMLAPGVRFGVGDSVVECVEVRAVDAADTNSEQVKSGDDNNPAPAPAAAEQKVEMPRLVVCPTCYRDMTSVPSVARFCPNCGSQLPPRDAAGFLIPPEESSPLFPVYKALRDELETKLAADESPQAATSLIILAYANALLNLGWRYEHGRGLLRNVEEAARCYAKAGKLSEAWGKGA